MAWKYIAQVVVTGSQIVGRAFARAVRQEYQASQQAARARTDNGGSGGGGTKSKKADAYTGLSLQESKQILNLTDLNDLEQFQKNTEHLFNVNERSKGGSLYLQSKVVRAKERIEMEILREAEAAANKEQKKQEETQS